MHRVLMTEHWPKTDDGQVIFVDTNHAFLYALVIWDDKALCANLLRQLRNLQQQYKGLKGQPASECLKLSDLAFAIQFTREAWEETHDLQVRAKAFAAE